MKKKYKLPLDKEIKWSYLWSLYKYQKENIDITCDEPYFFLNDFPYEKLKLFYGETLSLLNDLSYKKIIITVTKNSDCNNINEVSFYKMHIQEHMQRIEMEVQLSEDNLCVLFFDHISEKTNDHLRNAYNQLYASGDFIDKYSHIKDSLNLQYSHHSIGLQLADFISGCFGGFLKDYEISTDFFNKTIADNLRKNNSGHIMGYGIREVPRNDNFRSDIKQKIEKCKSTRCIC